MFRKFLLVACGLLLIASSAEARPHHRHYRHHHYRVQPVQTDWNWNQPFQQPQIRTTEVRGQGVVGGRPPGCPRAFCGCGASIELFGRIIPSLNLAANWLRFPPASPGYNMVGARRGHVFVLKQHVAGDIWLVKDYNSGGHLTRLHERSIRGYSIRNPMASLPHGFSA